MLILRYHKDTGVIRSVMCTNTPLADIVLSDSDTALLPVDVLVDPELFYVKDGGLTPYPARPDQKCYWDGHAWVLDTFRLQVDVRNKRDRLLAESDWTDTLSAQGRLGSSLYYSWQDYRQALRDITKQPGFPLDITWPTPP